jgi:hypothetical protein
MGPALIGISGMMFFADLQRSQRKGYGSDVQAYREAQAAKFYGLVVPFLNWTLSSISPGGGGPGLSPTSTNPPPSIEATGASLAQHGKTEGPARVSKRGSRPRRKRCPKGYRWSRRHRKCMRADRLFPFRYWTSQYGNGGKH